MKQNRGLSILPAAAAAMSWGAFAGAEVTVVYTEIVTHSSSLAPGMLDLTGNPAQGRFTALFDIAVSHDGSQWVLRADTDLPTTHDQVLLLGSGTSATPLAQDGRPVPGSTTGELWDFFDSDYPASFNENGDIAYSGRARPSTSIKEKIMKVVGNVQTIFATESTPVTGLVDLPPNPTGDELIGNSVGSVSFLNNGQVFFGNTPIQNCHSSRYPALFLDTTGFAQSGVTTIGFETWDNFGFGDCGMAPNGVDWFALGDTENPDTSLDRIFAVNNIKIVQENTQIGTTGIIAGDIFFARMIRNGDWFARGDDTADNDWALRGNAGTFELIAKTGDPITTSSSELWGNSFLAFHGNAAGDWVMAGNTNSADVLLNDVLVLNGEQIVLHEGDPIDLDGNGQFDDNVFVGGTGVTAVAFAANDLLITDDGIIHVIVILRDGAGTNLGDAYLQINVNMAPCPADTDDSGSVDVLDLLAVINGWGPCPAKGPCPGDIDGCGVVDVQDLLAVISEWGPCP